MRISEIYKLNRSQPSLDFVDIDVEKDTPLFITPTALKALPSEWSAECIFLIQHFFSHILKLIRDGKHDEAKKLLSMLQEPNETYLGLSKGKPMGRAVGNLLASKLWESLSESRAVTTGLLEDLEETSLFVERIGVDIISDITTNIIRELLIQYTQETCEWYEIPMQKGVDSGPIWDCSKYEWTSETTELPVVKGMKVLLVPKDIVRRCLDYDPGEYYRDYVLTHMQKVELDARSDLVQVLKNGNERVTKKSLEKKYSIGKKVNVRLTKEHPEILERYRKDKEENPSSMLSHEEISSVEKSRTVNFTSLVESVVNLSPGRDTAGEYERRVEAFLSPLFYPSLTSPNRQMKLHKGRKRVDIAYINSANSEFFYWLKENYAAPRIFVECKNFTREVGNPELDQLSGRFGPSYGKVGILVCRRFEDKEKFFQRCQDTEKDDRGYIIPLDDEDLKVLVKEREEGKLFKREGLLWERFNRLFL